MTEYERIVEYSFNKKQETFVVRFLSGESYALNITNLPKKMLTKKPDWENSYLSDNQDSIIFPAGKDLRMIAAHVIHSRGKLL